MTAAQRAMMTWLGALGRGGVATGEASAGEAVAAFVVGEEALDQLRAFLTEIAPDAAARERRAAIEVCIWMAHADREIHPEERHLLSRLVQHSGLDADTQDALVEAVHEPPPIDGVEARLTHPVLRELILALAWELALADGRVDPEEAALYESLAERFEIDPARRTELRDAIDQRVG